MRYILILGFALSIFTGSMSKANGHSVTVVFSSDFSPPTKVVLQHGGTMKIMYALPRFRTFNNCFSGNSFSGGFIPNWSVDGGRELNSGYDQMTEGPIEFVSDIEYLTAFIQLPNEGRNLSLWFLINNNYGACGIDSNLNSNYEFPFSN